MGADFVRIDRMARYVATAGEYGLALVYSPRERERVHNREFAAGRLAVKEALLKAIGVGFGRGVRRLAEIETLNGPSGAPEVTVYGAVRERLEELGVRRIHATITHERDHALAVVLLTA
jgi:holo-[acyl-carrier protein] synthase